MAKRKRRSARPPSEPAPPPIAAPPPAISEQAIVVARGRQRRLDVTLVRGSILDVPARALVLGLFRNVDPGGAAKAIDIRLSGALTELMRSRTVSPEAGSVFVLPTARTGLLVEMVVFAGLGPFDRFNSSVIQLVASNLVRTLVRGNVEEFSAVLFGGGSGFDVRECAQHLLSGVVGSLRDVDPHHRFRGFTICELDETKFDAIRDQIYAGCREEFCSDVDVVVRERRLSAPERVRRPAAARPSPVEAEPLYLLVRSDVAGGATLSLRCAVLTSGSKAAVLEGTCEIPRKDLDKELGLIEQEQFDTAALTKLGRRLAKLALPEPVRAELAKAGRRHVAVVHDLEAARLPWECLELDGWVPALTAGMSRRYVANNLAVGRWAEHREHDRELSLLLIVDPNSNLPGAVRESESIRQLVAADPRVRVTTLAKDDATKEAVLAHFRSERFDAIHYAGHAQFDAQTVGESGIICADGTLRAVDLLNLRSLPGLMFFNACESGRLRKRSAQPAAPLRTDVRKKLTETVGFAESFMRYGVMNYVGTYWPVGDDSAAGFARAFYSALINGQSIGEALISGRQAVQKTDSIDWADYIHYGDPRFTLKRAT